MTIRYRTALPVSDRPQLHLEPGILPRHMHGDATGCGHLAPIGAVGIHFEVYHTRMIGDLPRRHRQGAQRDPWQRGVHQLTDFLDRADLGLTGKVATHILGRDLGADRQDKPGIAQQFAVRDNPDGNTLFARLQLD